MNIFNKVALQGLRKNRTRTLVTIVGVLLSAVMITGVATFGTSLLHYLVNSSIAKYGDWHVEFPSVNSAVVQEQGQDKAVAATATFANGGYALLEGAKSPEKPYLFLAAFNDKTFDTLPVTLISGKLPTTGNEVVISSHIADKAGVRIALGDTLTLAIGNREADGRALSQHDPYRPDEKLAPTAKKTFTVVGVCERPGFEEHSAPGYTLITKADAEFSGDDFSLFVTLKNPKQAPAYASGVTGAGAYLLNEDVLRFMGASDNTLFNTLLYSVGGILVAIIVVGSVFLIYNSFNISLNERTHQFGLLMSVGATARQLRNSVLFEALCIGVIGIPLGILTGIGCVDVLLPVVAANFSTIINSQVPLTLSVSFPVLVMAAVVSLVTILISAYLPAKRAASIPVMECIRQTNEIKTEAKAMQTSRLTERMFGLEGSLALKNFKRNKKRYRSIVLSLTLSVVLFVSGNAFGTTLKQLAKAYTVEMDGDIVFYADGMTENEAFPLFDKLKTADGLTKSNYQANLTYPARTSDLPSDFLKAYREATGDAQSGQALSLPVDVQFIEDELYFDFIQSLGLPRSEYTGPDAKVLIVGIRAEDHQTFFTNQTMNFTLTSPSGEKTLKIGATFVDTYPLDPLPMETQSAYVFMMVAPWEVKAQFDTLDTPARYGLNLWSNNPALSVVQMQSIIRETGVASDYTLHNLSSVVDMFRSGTFVVDVFTYVFIIMLSLIAVANVFNTISTNIRLRRRELAMLRSVGMSERSFNKMMNFECVFYGMRTLLYGVPIAGLLSWLIFKVMASQEEMDNLSFLFPWRSIGISIFSVLLIVFVTMLYAISKIKKENIIDALRDEMT